MSQPHVPLVSVHYEDTDFSRLVYHAPLLDLYPDDVAIPADNDGSHDLSELFDHHR